MAALMIVLATLIGSTVQAADGTAHQAKALKIMTLSTMLTDTKGLGEWGYAALVEVDGERILFDTGANPDIVLRNADVLEIDLSTVEDVIISHFHDDHTGGLITLRKAMMAKNPSALSRLHVGSGIFDARYEAGGAGPNERLFQSGKGLSRHRRADQRSLFPCRACHWRLAHRASAARPWRNQLECGPLHQVRWQSRPRYAARG